MIDLATYKGLYPYAALDRQDGVLTVRFHSGGGQWQFGQVAQDTMTRLFRDIADEVWRPRIAALEARRTLTEFDTVVARPNR